MVDVACHSSPGRDTQAPQLLTNGPLTLDDLHNTALAFKGVPTVELWQRYLMFRIMDNPRWLERMTGVAHWALEDPVAKFLRIPRFAVRRGFYQNFCAGEDLPQAVATIKRNYHQTGAGALLDCAIESVRDQEGAKVATEKIMRTIDAAHQTGRITPVVAVKVSGVVRPDLLSQVQESLRAGDPPENPSNPLHQQWQAETRRMWDICSHAQSLGVCTGNDAEHYGVEGAIRHLTRQQMRHFNRELPFVQLTLQAYRRDCDHILDCFMKDAFDNAYVLGVRIVRGAYMDEERELARRLEYADPIQATKDDTDRAFDRLFVTCLDNPRIVKQVTLAGHNKLSVVRATEQMREREIEVGDPRVGFAQLYGMAPTITRPLALFGYRTFDYMPWGSIEDCLAYLTRRGTENKTDFTSRELDEVEQELWRRGGRPIAHLLRLQELRRQRKQQSLAIAA